MPTEPARDAAERRGASEIPTTSAEYITRLAGGENLIDGLPTWRYAESHKSDLPLMLRCCEAELKSMQRARTVAAPYYFERAAILLRKSREYEHEAALCERYVREVEAYYLDETTSPLTADVRKGPRFEAIVARVQKAKYLAGRAPSAA